jgi:hypothetical protein
VLNSVTWQPLLECHHGSPVDEPAEVAVYQEVEEPRGVLAPMQVRRVYFYIHITAVTPIVYVARCPADQVQYVQYAGWHPCRFACCVYGYSRW